MSQVEQRMQDWYAPPCPLGQEPSSTGIGDLEIPFSGNIEPHHYVGCLDRVTSKPLRWLLWFCVFAVIAPPILWIQDLSSLISGLAPILVFVFVYLFRFMKGGNAERVYGHLRFEVKGSANKQRIHWTCIQVGRTGSVEIEWDRLYRATIGPAYVAIYPDGAHTLNIFPRSLFSSPEAWQAFAT